MDIQGEYRIESDRETVWKALNDPTVLKECIPGCESLEKTSDTEMTATVTSKVGPVKAKFNGNVTLEDLNPPESYRIVGEGKGGVAGFAKGGADVKLTEDGSATILTYNASAQVGGKLAQLGSRLIESTAKKMADDFFRNFADQVSPSVADDDTYLDPGLAELATEEAIEQSPTIISEAIEDIEHSVEEKIVEAEEEVEGAAARGFLGGPYMWGLLVLAVVSVALALMR